MISPEKLEQLVNIIKSEVLKSIVIPTPEPGKDAEVDYEFLKKYIEENIVPGKDADEIDYEKILKALKQLVIDHSIPGDSPKVDYKKIEILNTNNIKALLKKMVKPGEPGKDAILDMVALEEIIEKHSEKVDYDSIKKFIKKQYVPPGMEELEALIIKYSQTAEITKAHLEQVALLVPQPEQRPVPVYVVDIAAKQNMILVTYSDGSIKEVPLELLFHGVGGGVKRTKKSRTRVYESRLKVLGSPILVGTNISLDSFTGISGKVSRLGNSAAEFNKNSGLYIWVDGVKGLKGTLAAGDDVEYVDIKTFKVFRDININEILTIEEIG